MGNFFHGWRRKAGCVTLLMACAAVYGWKSSMNQSVELFVEWSGTVKTVLRSAGGSIQYVEATEQYFGNRDEEVWFQYPYWSIVIPLTLLSAWLLLSKPRVPAPKKISDPAPVEET